MCILINTQSMQTSDTPVALNFTKTKFILILAFLFDKAVCIFFFFLKCSLLSKAGIFSYQTSRG